MYDGDIVPGGPIVGRSRELAALCHLLRQTYVRLATITGPGGVGKTQLALHAAIELRPDFGRVAVVSLAPAHNAEQVPVAIAQALDLLAAGDHEMVERLVERLGDTSSLLVLDNFEHVLPAAPLVARLLGDCPALRVLVTSRATLRLRGEHEFALPPLAVADAVALFLQFVHQHRSDFRLTPENSPAVHELCARLDGLPLALELAAARMRLLTPQSLLARLSHRLDVLADGPIDAPRRQRTLRDAVAWSYELLAPPEQRALRWVGVCVAGFPLAIARALLGDDDTTLHLLDRLINHSLVQLAGDEPEPRYALLESIRAFAMEELRSAGEEHAALSAYAGAWLDIAETAAPHLNGEQQQRWVDQLDRERFHLSAVLQWAIEHAPAIAARMVIALWRFWYARSYLREGLSWHEALLAEPGAMTDDQRLAVSRSAALFATAVSRLEDAERFGLAALELARRLDAQEHAAAIAATHAVVLTWRGRYDEAVALSAASVESSRSAGGVAYATLLAYHGHVCYFAGALEAARAAFAMARPILEAHRDTWGSAFAAYGAGLVEVAASNPDAAQPLLEVAHERDLSIGNRRGLVRSLYGLGQVARLRGDYATAGARLHDGLAIAHDIGDLWSACRCLEAMAGPLIAERRYIEAARLFGLAERLRDQLGAPIPPGMAHLYAEDRQILEQQVEGARLQQAFAEGRDLTVEQALAPLPVHAPTPADTRPAETLTSREIDVLRLVAGGLTNQQIAAALVISLRTVHSHLNAIYSKLGIGNRSAATRWAIEHGVV